MAVVLLMRVTETCWTFDDMGGSGGWMDLQAS
jgi:hypothetical protein